MKIQLSLILSIKYTIFLLFLMQLQLEGKEPEKKYQFKRVDGSTVTIEKSKIKYLKNNESILKWSYKRSKTLTQPNTLWNVTGDCKTYKANWEKDNMGWLDIRNPKNLYESKEITNNCKKQLSKWYEPAKEAKFILDKFCK